MDRVCFAIKIPNGTVTITLTNTIPFERGTHYIPGVFDPEVWGPWTFGLRKS